jgi:hypothetical protein
MKQTQTQTDLNIRRLCQTLTCLNGKYTHEGQAMLGAGMFSELQHLAELILRDMEGAE